MRFQLFTYFTIYTLVATVSARVTAEDIQAEQNPQNGASPYANDPDLAARAEAFEMPISDEDRYESGNTIVRGLATENRELGYMLNVKEVSSSMRGLANAFPGLKFFTGANETFERRLIHGFSVGETPKAIILGGMHGHERGGPDYIIHFVSDLLHANKTGQGLTYPNQFQRPSKTFTDTEVKAVLSAGFVAVPLVNPDGMAYDQRTNSCWRKTRAHAAVHGEKVHGVDINRNFDALWDFSRLFNMDFPDTKLVGSKNPTSSVYHGLTPNSEVETQNIVNLIQEYQNITWLVDLHSFGPAVYYGWGDDDIQTTRPHSNFANASYDGLRGVIDQPTSGFQGYEEYMEEEDLKTQLTAAERIAKTMSDAGHGEIIYAAEQSVDRYPTSGSITDYCLADYYSHKCNAKLIHGLTIGFNVHTKYQCPFYPYIRLYHEGMRQVGAGLMEFLLVAAEQGDKVKRWKCDK